MSLRRFCGWEPAEVTTHEYDERDRLAASVTRREPEWDDAQRAWMLALGVYEQSLCRRCGHNLHDTLDPDTSGTMLASREWVAEESQCFGCTALAVSEQARSGDDNNKIPLQALIYTARMVPNWRYKGAPKVG